MPNEKVSPAGQRILRLLLGRPPQSVGELVRSGDVTRTAVTEQLDALVAQGYVGRTQERLTGRGRPRHLYHATQAALALVCPGSQQQLMTPAMWQAISDIGGEPLVKKVVKRVSRAMADYYNAQITATRPRDRLRQFIQLLSDEGGLADSVEGPEGHWTFYRRSCPFISIADAERNVCLIDRETLEAIIGCPVRRTACREDGNPCCTFEIVAGE